VTFKDFHIAVGIQVAQKLEMPVEPEYITGKSFVFEI